MQVDLPDATVIDYVIDGLGRRIAKKVDGAITQKFLYGSGLLPVAELNPTGTVVSTFIYASQSHVPDFMIKGGVTYRIVTDHLGSPRLVVNVSTGDVAQSLDYDEFGVVIEDTNPGFQPFGFAGGLYDPDTALVRFGARDYDPETGRWTAKDPIGFEGGDTNLYTYVGNNPVNFIDPTGEILFVPILLAAWAAVEVGLAVVDAISTASTLMDECASGLEKALTLGLFVVGALAPGGGYSTGGKAVVKAAKSKGARTTLYRAVSKAELDDIGKVKGFRPKPGQMQGKWFAESAEDAQTWGKALYGREPHHIVKTTVPDSVANRMYRDSHLDSMPARYAEGDLLDLLNQSNSGISHHCCGGGPL